MTEHMQRVLQIAARLKRAVSLAADKHTNKQRTNEPSYPASKDSWGRHSSDAWACQQDRVTAADKTRRNAYNAILGGVSARDDAMRPAHSNEHVSSAQGHNNTHTHART